MLSLRRCMPSTLAQALRDQPLSPEKVRFSWRITVGETLARVTQVSLRSKGTLEVHLNDQRWGQEIGRSSSLIINRMEIILGPDIVKSIVLSNLNAAPRQPNNNGVS